MKPCVWYGEITSTQSCWGGDEVRRFFKGLRKGLEESSATWWLKYELLPLEGGRRLGRNRVLINIYFIEHAQTHGTGSWYRAPS